MNNFHTERYSGAKCVCYRAEFAIYSVIAPFGRALFATAYHQSCDNVFFVYQGYRAVYAGNCGCAHEIFAPVL